MGKTKQQGGALDIMWGALLARLAVWLLGKTGRGLKRLTFRWRRALTPVIVGGLLWLIAVIWHALAPWTGWFALAIPVGTGTLAYFGPVLNERWSLVVTKLVPAGLDRGRSGVLDRPIERGYLAGLGAAVGVYLAVRVGLGGSDFTLWWWRLAVLGFGGAWWYHRRIRTAGRADRIAKRWTRIADRDRCPDSLKPIAGTKVLGAYQTGRTGLLHVRLPEGVTIDTLMRVQRNLASFYKARPQSIFPREDEHHANEAWITFLPKNPFEGDLEHPAPEPGTYSLRSLGRRLPIGIYTDGTQLDWKISHCGVYGQSGGGKSGFIHNLMRWLAGATDAIIVGIDMAGGATLGVWRKALALPLADDLHSAAVNLEAVLRFIEARERRLGLDDDGDADEFLPTDEEPWLFLVIDEFPDLIAAARNAGEREPGLAWIKWLNNTMGRIAKKARKCGVRIIIGTQNATKEDMGTTEFRGQLVTTVGLLLNEQQNKNLWGDGIRSGWTSRGLGQGVFMLQDPEHQVPLRTKGWWVPKPERKLVAAKAEDLRKMAEAEAWAALMGTNGVVVVVPGEVVPARERDAVLRALTESATGVLNVKELQAETGLSRSQVYKRLSSLGEGQVRKLGGGRFARVGDTRVPVNAGK
jgi:hypothetical protein